MPRYIGKEMSRVDGVAKVTGKAKYAAEFKVPNLAYGFIVQGSIAKGSIQSIDTREAEAALRGARPLAHNAYKVELGRRAVVRALMRASRLAAGPAAGGR